MAALSIFWFSSIRVSALIRLVKTLLDFLGEKWRRDNRCAGITLYLRHSSPPVLGDNFIQGGMELDFLPGWVTWADYEKTVRHRTLHLTVSFWTPRTGDWRSLAGQRLEGRPPDHDDEPIESWKLAGAETAEDLVQALPSRGLNPASTPEIHVWSADDGSLQTHLDENSLRDCVVTFGEWSERDPFELPFTIEGLIITPAAAQARYALLCARVHEFMGLPHADLDKLEIRSKEGQPFRYASVIRFDKIFCWVPLNTPDPVAYARQMARRQLNATEFARCRINGMLPDGKPDPRNAISQEGILVILSNPHGPRPGLWLPGAPGEP